MTAIMPSSGELERFRAAIGERLGLWLDDTKLAELSMLLSRRCKANVAAPASYLALIDDMARGQSERRLLAQELTVTETYFFRQGAQLVTLADHFEGRSAPIRVLSAGCASGEEPYSIAITLRMRVPQLASTATIRAVDINPAMLERAKLGRYSSWALRETPEAVANRWFRREAGNNFLLDQEIRGAVDFQERNLIEPEVDLFTPATYDAIFFRNVLMYFTPRAATAIIERVARALVPGGLLFLGYAETLRGLSTAFHLRRSRETFYYQKRDGAAPPLQARPVDAFVRDAPEGRDSEQPSQPSSPWYELIGDASERVRKLTERPATDAPRAAQSDSAFDLGATFELLRKERYGDALDAMQVLPQAAGHDPDVLLLRCALLVHSGELHAARATCTTLLERDELNAGAHYLLALICENERDFDRATEHNRIAAHLDADFAMPRLHLGLLARRKGDALTARRELRQAFSLLEREDTARLLLFAGGFERAALLALCRAELQACGGAL